MPVRMIVALVLATAALPLLAPAADAAPTVTARIGGVEYAATSTQGRFGGAADGQVRGAWQATVVHDPLRSGKAVPITDGSFTLRSTQREVRGTFVSGTVTPRPTPSTCGNERFDVRGHPGVAGRARVVHSGPDPSAGAEPLRVPDLRRGRRRHARAPGVTVGGPK